MYTKKILCTHVMLATGIVLSSQALAVGGNATPTQYDVNVENVEFHQVGAPADSFFTYRSGTSNIDIASVSPNEAAGGLQPTATPPNGNYDEFRVLVSKTFVVTAQTTGNLSNGKPCRTVANGAAILDPFGDGSVSVGYQGSTDGAAGESETISVPSGSAVILPSGVSFVGNSLQATFPASFTVANAVPQGTVKFNVTNAVDFEPTGASSCVVFPMPPSIEVTVA